MTKLLPVLVLALFLIGACSNMPDERVDASDVMAAGRSLMVVLEGVGQGLVQGKVSIDQVKAIVPEMFQAGVTTNRWLFAQLNDATNGQPLPEEAKRLIMGIAQRLEGMSAQDIIDSVGNVPTASGTLDYSSTLDQLSNKIKQLVN